MAPEELTPDFDTLILAGGAGQSRELDVPGSDLQGVFYAMESLVARNQAVKNKKGVKRLSAAGRHMLVVWAILEGQEGAQAVDRYLMGESVPAMLSWPILHE